MIEFELNFRLMLIFPLQCRFTKHHVLHLKVTEYAFENQIAQLEQVLIGWKII